MTVQSIRTVLLADDDPAVLASLQQSLAQAGYRALAAVDGQDALAQYEALAGPIDLLVTDLQMPFLDGLDLARHIRSKQPTVPIVFITGDSSSGPLPTVEEFPNHLFFHKPFPPSELIAELPNP